MHADKWGPAGSILSALCCLGAAPLLGALSAIGLGFLIHDWILIPLLLFFLWATLRSLSRDAGRHGSTGPERTAAIGAVFTVVGLWISGVVVGIGLALLVAGSAWNWVRVRRLGRAEGAAA
ncbi:MAG: MerC family mercury resistance protein [Gemmatimonadota bacterium]